MKTAKKNTPTETAHHAGPNKDDSSIFSSQDSKDTPFFGPNTIQPKLEIGSPDDKYEREADRVADAVVNSPAPSLHMKCKECEEESLQMKSKNTQNGIKVPDQTSQQIQNPRTGSTLPESINQEMSHKIGADFSNVHIHTGSEAARLNDALGARAFTHGSDIYFNSGEYNPNTLDGKHLLAHELVHTAQQNRHHLIQREPAATVTIGAVLAWCLSGAGVTVLFDTIFQLGKGVLTRNLSWNYCKALISALLGCVFGFVGGPIAAQFTRELGKVTVREFSAWVKRKLIVAGYTQLAGKWGMSIAKLGCEDAEIDLNELIRDKSEDIDLLLPGHGGLLTGDTRSAGRRDQDDFMNTLNETRMRDTSEVQESEEQDISKGESSNYSSLLEGITLYTVREGDTLTSIAHDFGLSGGWNEIYELNKDILPDPDTIQTGQMIGVPAPPIEDELVIY